MDILKKLEELKAAYVLSVTVERSDGVLPNPAHVSIGEAIRLASKGLIVRLIEPASPVPASISLRLTEYLPSADEIIVM